MDTRAKSERALPLMTCWWPGLSRLWLQGQWVSLFAACGFALLFNYALLATYFWPELLPAAMAPFLWCAVVVIWVAGIWCGLHDFPERLVSASPDSEQDLFLRAQGEYLSGRWDKAEALIKEMLDEEPNDIDAHLMLATLWRHVGHLDEAQQRLLLLEEIDDSEKWRKELEQERRLLSRLNQAA
ncbi:MAG: tetratricopeptide repeat protein [Pirellulaceae bacterium]|nr:tetratricopeptide repeat protein [Pirellulaceae bacterium]